MRIEFNMASLSTPRPLRCEALQFKASIFTPDRRRFWQH
jgi:hypothetical protein